MKKLTAIERTIGALWDTRDAILELAEERRRDALKYGSIQDWDRGVMNGYSSAARVIEMKASHAFTDWESDQRDESRKRYERKLGLYAVTGQPLTAKERRAEIERWDSERAAEVDAALDAGGD